MHPIELSTKVIDSGIVDQMRKRVIELDGGHVIRDQVRGVYGYTG